MYQINVTKHSKAREGNEEALRNGHWSTVDVLSVGTYNLDLGNREVLAFSEVL